ncbi:MAG: FecR family protein, partial [Chloroflexi bacterium]|nr:FecR family protein [Chloroflexota bacterium]
MAGDTIVRSVSDGAAGKSLLLDQGILQVDAVKQPAGRPLVISTAQAESTVLGTQFILQALPGATRIDVREGRVKFTRLPQAVSTVTVSAGQYAVAGPGGDLAAKSGIGNWKAPPAGLQMWFRADQGVKAGVWTDQSPAGNTATQDKPGAQPFLLANAHGTRPALRFDGADDYFQLPDGFNDFRAGLTAFVVVRPAPGGAWSRFIDLDVGPACENIVFGRKDASDKLGFWVYTNSLTKGKVEAPGAIVANEV